jgi:hypothetical protein
MAFRCYIFYFYYKSYLLSSKWSFHESVELEEPKTSYADLIKEMQTLKGFKLCRDIELLNMTLNAFYRNFKELNMLIDIFENDPDIWYLRNKQRFDALWLDIIGSFHNYLSSVSSRLDHMRRFEKHLENKNIDDFYQNELEKLNSIEVVPFMKDFRNYIQHNELPLTKVTLSVKLTDKTNSSWEPKLLLVRHELLKWDGWTSKPKEYLRACLKIKLGSNIGIGLMHLNLKRVALTP